MGDAADGSSGCGGGTGLGENLSVLQVAELEAQSYPSHLEPS